MSLQEIYEAARQEVEKVAGHTSLSETNFCPSGAHHRSAAAEREHHLLRVTEFGLSIPITVISTCLGVALLWYSNPVIRISSMYIAMLITITLSYMCGQRRCFGLCATYIHPKEGPTPLSREKWLGRDAPAGALASVHALYSAASQASSGRLRHLSSMSFSIALYGG
ncbi:uncharacterized protein B0I36DRAFT_89376 [Microdochium trichocladiopsis]|uniref:Uncharacterized protein n=1 Tax=Microdochium trichocladiopsis TaxID=1682393 RepID=A0A9P8YC55_9PEZI|nr:uncharacterized protein B0I36DRAFT_89376 [Microdochium trichocladiopsis]KAH7035195.1 hypothetical protein B0I36DRAFT_89376 [Microdochium trichocladiopsis]